MTSKKYNKLKYIQLSYLILFLVGLFFVLSYSKAELHLTINKYNNEFFDVFFKYITYLGDGVLFGVLIVYYFFIRKKTSLAFVFTGILTLLLTHFFKKIIFKGLPRPIAYFKTQKLHLIEGVEMAHWHSFPSGHTTTAFAIATVLILSTKNKNLQIIYFILAALAGFSRVYLSQHFVADILAGSVLGIVIGVLSLKITSLIRPKNA